MKHFSLLVVALLLFAACSAEQAPLVANDVVITRPPPGMQMSAGYLTLSNNTAATITIDRVASPEFASVAMHESVLEDGISRMYPLDTVAIPAGESVHFKPGGKHLMLMRPTGDASSTTLEFYSGDALLLTVDATMSD